MKKVFFFLIAVFGSLWITAQKYPEPEFSNEVYFLKKDSVNTLIRLEKGASKMDTKMKMGGFGGTESGYVLEGEKSPVKISGGANLSFIISNGASAQTSFSGSSDSTMRANGIDPSELSGMGMGSMSDPANSISLYKAEPGKGERKILMQKGPGMLGFGAKKAYSGTSKHTFSVRKIREGYWELVIDKALTKGEYSFVVMNTGMDAMDGSMLLFAFAIDAPNP